MKSIGLDIGTTTICGIVLDAETGMVLKSETKTNYSAIEDDIQGFEKLQDVSQILSACNQIIDMFLETYHDIRHIGVTGQMHGILYLDEEGNAVSPLYSWQDSRGNCIYKNGMTYSQYATQVTGYQMATGYGMMTHFYNQENDVIPKPAVCFCTIPDFVAMKLAQKKRPVLHKSMAASLGLYDLTNRKFDTKAAEKLKMGTHYFPDILEEEISIGKYKKEISVSAALGDNQASFLGSVKEESNILLNIGTGSQISIFTSNYNEEIKIEYRPYIDNTFLMVGAPLCGGASYALLKDFYERVLEMFGYCEPDNMYDVMNRAAQAVYQKENKIVVDTKFNGTRDNPQLRGSIKNLAIDNFTPELLTLGMLEGICDELYAFYNQIPKEDRNATVITGSGNGIRKNYLLREIAKGRFEKKLVTPVYGEEASCGAALYSLYADGYFKEMKDIQKIIQTQEGEL